MTRDEVMQFVEINPDDTKKLPCWHWLGPVDAAGRPMVYVRGRRQLVPARRVVYEACTGEQLPPGWSMTYRCSSSDCVRHEHQAKGTNKSISKLVGPRAASKRGPDAYAKLARTKQAQSALTWDIVHKFRRLCANGSTTRAAARACGIKEANASVIRRQKTWREPTGLASIARQAGLL